MATTVFGKDIKPNRIDAIHEEGSNVILHCSQLPGTGDYIFWYRQYERSSPEFLVRTFESAKEAEISEVDSRFSVNVVKQEKTQVVLGIISAAVSDSAVYYCALRPTVSGNMRALCKNLTHCKVQQWIRCNSEDKVYQQTRLASASEDNTVRLDCSYQTSFSNPTLFWYQQKPTGIPRLILRKFSITGFTEADFMERFQVNLNKTSVPLTIKDLHVSDSAVYYCALMPTDT
ncbi:hypothetical protein DNTS_029944 [Danionella cerebrum]|uniref:Ig-like domain-containing protein n=1 Tax=Danionella cerebrum TaxID=2873325 RepID=A0A553RQ09_9TELE|nr:hypothetical protein DNTS_029944 [Danionella translucida]